MYLVIAMAAALVLSWTGAGLATWYLDGKAEAAEGRARAAQAALGAERQARETSNEVARACSASVGALQAAGRAAEERLESQKATSRQLTTSVQAHVQAMLNRPRDPGLDECQAMKKELDDEIDYRARRLRHPDGRELPRT